MCGKGRVYEDQSLQRAISDMYTVNHDQLLEGKVKGEYSRRINLGTYKWKTKRGKRSKV
jgi:hypothetical protein